MTEYANHPTPRFFVVGATGYTGRSLVEAARAQGIATIAHIRPESSRLEALRETAQALGAQVDTTAWDEAAMTATLRERAPTAIFALLGTTKKHAKRAAARGIDAGYEAVDYGLTALLIRATIASEVPARFVYLSSMGVSHKAPRNRYLNVRWRLEQELAESALDFTVARPSFITGPGRDESRPGERMGAALGDGLLRVMGTLGATAARDNYRSITGPALARALVRLALDPTASRRTVDAKGLR